MIIIILQILISHNIPKEFPIINLKRKRFIVVHCLQEYICCINRGRGLMMANNTVALYKKKMECWESSLWAFVTLTRVSINIMGRG